MLNGEKFYENVIRVDIQKNAKTKENYDAKRTIFVGNLGYSKFLTILLIFHLKSIFKKILFFFFNN